MPGMQVLCMILSPSRVRVCTSRPSSAHTRISSCWVIQGMLTTINNKQNNKRNNTKKLPYTISTCNYHWLGLEKVSFFSTPRSYFHSWQNNKDSKILKFRNSTPTLRSFTISSTSTSNIWYILTRWQSVANI